MSAEIWSYKLETTVTVDGITGTFTKWCDTLAEAQAILDLPNHYGPAFITAYTWGDHEPMPIFISEAFHIRGAEDIARAEKEAREAVAAMAGCNCTRHGPKRIDFYPGRTISGVCYCEKCAKRIREMGVEA